MGRFRFALCAAFGVVAISCATAGAASREPRLVPVKDFAFALGVNADKGSVAQLLAGYDLVVVDGETRGRSVATIRGQGAIVLGYLSIGTIEPYRPWYRKLKRYSAPCRPRSTGGTVRT